MKRWWQVVLLGILSIGVLSLSGCEDEEANDLAKAQACMDKISSTNYASAAACMQFVAKYNSQQANILKCSIKFLEGGLTTEKVGEAYKRIAITGGASSNEATFIAMLALTPASTATDADVFCQRTGLEGLTYLSNLAVIGSTMTAAAAAALGGGFTYDPTDPSTLTDAQVNQIMAECQPPNTCNGELATIGAAVATLSGSYCDGANSSTEVCTKINAAVSGAGGDTALIAKQLFCAMDDLTFDATANAGLGGCI